MSSSKDLCSPHPNRFKSPYPDGWVNTEKTREILNDIDDPFERHKFMKKVASRTKADWSPIQIEGYYRKRGYKAKPKNWWDSESDTESTSDSPTSPQRGGDPRQARPAHEIGGNGGKKRDSDHSYSYTSGAGSDSYASRPGLQGPSLMPPRVSLSGKLHPISKSPPRYSSSYHARLSIHYRASILVRSRLRQQLQRLPILPWYCLWPAKYQLPLLWNRCYPFG